MKTDFHRMLVEETPDALIATSPDGTVLQWNRGAETTFGYTSAEAVGHSLDELIVPPDRLEEENAIQREALDTGGATYESYRRKKDGSLIYIIISTRAVRHGHEELDALRRAGRSSLSTIAKEDLACTTDALTNGICVSYSS